MISKRGEGDMAEFSVRTRELERWSQRIGSEANKTGNYGNRVEQISRDCSLDGSAGVTVKRNLVQIAAELAREARELGNMERILNGISMLYRSAESRIVSDGKFIPPLPAGNLWGVPHGGRIHPQDRIFRRTTDDLRRRYPLYPDVTSGFLSFLKTSGKSITKIYSYIEKSINPYDAYRLGGIMGGTMGGLSVFAALISAGENSGSMYRIWTDSSSSRYDKTAQSLKLGGSLLNLGTKAYIASEVKSKSLRFVNKRGMNQILDMPTLKYAAPYAVSDRISKASTAVAVVQTAGDTAAGFIRRYGQVSRDGQVTAVDVASIGIHGSLSGLSSVTSSLSGGIISFDSEKVAVGLETRSLEYLQGDSWEAAYVRDQSHNAAARLAVSMKIGIEMVTRTVVGGVGNGFRTVGASAKCAASWVAGGCRYYVQN